MHLEYGQAANKAGELAAPMFCIENIDFSNGPDSSTKYPMGTQCSTREEYAARAVAHKFAASQGCYEELHENVQD